MDLTGRGSIIDSRTFRSFEVFITLTGSHIDIVGAQKHSSYGSGQPWKRAPVKELLTELVGHPGYDRIPAHLRGAVHRLSVAHRVRRWWNSCGLRHFGEDKIL